MLKKTEKHEKSPLLTMYYSRVWHESNDQREHATAMGKDNEGNHTATCHIASDPEKQQQYRAKVHSSCCP